MIHVSRNCWLLDPEWLQVGWELWKTAAPWDRDYFLPVPTRKLEHWERYECRYSEASILSRVLEAQLKSNNSELLCPKVPGRLWKEHSRRAFLPSCTGCLKYPKNWQDAVGGWSPGQSQGRPHSQKAHLNYAESRGRTPPARQRRYVGRNGFKQRHLRTSAAIGIRRRHRPRTRETSVKSVRVQS